MRFTLLFPDKLDLEVPMKTLLTAAVLTVLTGSQIAYAQGGCHSTCADGYTYSSEKGACVPKTVSS